MNGIFLKLCKWLNLELRTRRFARPKIPTWLLQFPIWLKRSTQCEIKNVQTWRFLMTKENDSTWTAGISRNTCQCHTLLVYHFTIVLRIAEHSTARITEFNKRCKVILVSFFISMTRRSAELCSWWNRILLYSKNWLRNVALSDHNENL